jgi:hypothetical protein
MADDRQAVVTAGGDSDGIGDHGRHARLTVAIVPQATNRPLMKT